MLTDEWKEFLKKEGDVDFDNQYLDRFRRLNLFIDIRFNGRIIALCLLSLHGDLAHIGELTIAKEWRNKKIIRLVAIKGLQKFPFLKRFSFERFRKYNDLNVREYDLYRLIGLKERVHG